MEVYFSYAITHEQKARQEQAYGEWQIQPESFVEEPTDEGYIIVRKNGEAQFDYYPEAA